VEVINSESKHIFSKNLKKSKKNFYTQYICKDCLEDYVLNCDDPEEKEYRREHIKIIMLALEQYDNFQFHLLSHCPSMSLTLKKVLKESNDTDNSFLYSCHDI
jgi:hypothetical protein